MEFSVCSHSDIVHIPARLSERKQLGSTEPEWMTKCIKMCFFPRIVSLSLDGIRMNQISCLLAYLDYICRQCNACQIEAAVAADYEVYKDVTSAGTVRCLRETHYKAKVSYPQFWATWLQYRSDWHHVSFTIRVLMDLKNAIGNSLGFTLTWRGCFFLVLQSWFLALV